MELHVNKLLKTLSTKVGEDTVECVLSFVELANKICEAIFNVFALSSSNFGNYLILCLLFITANITILFPFFLVNVRIPAGWVLPTNVDVSIDI